MKPAIAIIGIAVLASCASRPPVSPEIIAEANRPLLCSEKKQCDLFWQRGSHYIATEAPYKVQLASENLVQTYSPTGGTTRLGYLMSREPLNDGSTRISIRVWCDNMFGCYPEQNEEISRFKRYVRSGNM